MSRYIDADKLLNRLPDDLTYKASVKRVLIQAPTADVVEVVRCKDCEYYEPHGNGKFGLCKCKKCKGIRSENDYCSNGVKRKCETN
jgi:hypothetical protein